jgi:plastocyanin
MYRIKTKNLFGKYLLTLAFVSIMSFLVGSISSASFAGAVKDSNSPFDVIFNSIRNLEEQNSILQNKVNALQTQVDKLNSEVNSLLPPPLLTNAVAITKGAGGDQSCVTTKNCFSPNVVNIATGDTVTWTNGDSVGHTVTSGNPSDLQSGAIFDSGLIKSGGMFSFTFQNPGTFNYFCVIHPWMTGTLTVK